MTDIADPGSSTPPAAGVDLADLAQHVRRAAFRRLMDGHEANIEYLAGRVQVSVAVAADAVDALVKARRAVTDVDGRVVGVAGLSLVETDHRLRIAGATAKWCWCAWDALGIVSALRLTAEVSTSCGACRRPVVVETTCGQLAAGRPEYGYLPPPAGTPLNCFCPYALLFCSEDHLASWQTALPANVAEGGRPLHVAGYAAEARRGWAWAGGEEGPG
jgi:Alkylmercury lyase